MSDAIGHPPLDIDFPAKNMDFFVKHLAPYPRQFPSELPVLNMGDIAEKDHWVRRTFSTCNFSFILRGRGEFTRKGETWKVEAPCVLTQWPGEKPHYGPLPETDTWDEVYLIYDALTMPRLRKRGFVSDDRPVWKIANWNGVLAQLDELRALVQIPETERVVDRIDRVCERMILESLAPAPGRTAKPGAVGTAASARIEALLRANPEHDFDFDTLARDHGLSPSTLRRQWAAHYAQPPGQYLLGLRIQKARRLLIESEARVGEIAYRVGFTDILYFSRRFHLMTGLSPSAYRKRYRLQPN